MFTRYISESLEQQIIALLDEWATGELGTALSWAKLEKSFGYSRQALSGNRAIKNKFDEAKAALRNRKKSVAVQNARLDELEALKNENLKLSIQVQEFEKRFMRWMHNCHLKAINPLDLDAPMGVSFKTAMRARDRT